jgi:hypothetical protein
VSAGLASQLASFDRRARLVIEGTPPSRLRLEPLIADGVATALALETRIARADGADAEGLRHDLTGTRRLVRHLMGLYRVARA